MRMLLVVLVLACALSACKKAESITNVDVIISADTVSVVDTVVVTDTIRGCWPPGHCKKRQRPPTR